MKRYLLPLFLFLYGAADVRAQEPDLSNVAVYTLAGKKHALTGYGSLCVFVFLSPGCPMSQKYTLTLNKLAKEFHYRVSFYGVFTDTEPVSAELAAFRKKYRIPFELVVDKDRQLVKALSASVTPEAFVLSKGKVVYHGAIDDWAIRLGTTKKGAAVNYVADAIRSAMANEEMVPNFHPPIGCYID